MTDSLLTDSWMAKEAARLFLNLTSMRIVSPLRVECSRDAARERLSVKLTIGMEQFHFTIPKSVAAHAATPEDFRTRVTDECLLPTFGSQIRSRRAIARLQAAIGM